MPKLTVIVKHERIKELREQSGLSIPEFAARVGISRQFATMVEKGAQTPGLDVLHSIADVFGVDVEDLYSTVRKED